MAVRETQVAIETVVSPTSGRVRVTQAVVESVVMSTSARVRVTQLAVETVCYIGTAKRPSPAVCVIS